MKKVFFLVFLGLVAVALIMPSAAAAANHALLIGVGAYPNLPPGVQLEGPARDVEALKKVLQKTWGLQPDQITVLLDNQATKAGILQAVEGLSRTTKPGDFIFIYFSGHGTSAYDESKMATGIDPQSGAIIPTDFRPGTLAQMSQMLIIGSRDFLPILSRLEQDRQILVVFDSCYSGGAVRSLKADRVSLFKFRYVPLSDLTDEVQVSYDTATVKESPYPYKNTIYISASRRREKAVDIPQAAIQAGFRTYDGQPHGALTNSLLSGLSGAADSNGDRNVSFRELYSYTRAMVAQTFPHTPQFLYSMQNQALTDSPIFKRALAQSTAAASKPGGPLRVKVEGVESDLVQSVRRIQGVEIVESDYDLVLSQSSGRYSLHLSNGYPLVAYPAAQRAEVVDRIARQRIIKDLAALTIPGQQFNVFVEILGGKGVLVEGEAVGFNIRAEQESYILLLDIDAAGTINVIYPANAGEMEPIPAQQDFRLENLAKVVPAFGTDYVKVFAFRQKPAGLEKFLGKSFQPSDPLLGDLINLIRQAGGGLSQNTIFLKTSPKTDLGK